MSQSLEDLRREISQCRVCADRLPLGPRPVVQVSTTAPLMIAAQAPGVRVHKTGVPFNDPSGDRLRNWLGIDRATFYDARRVNIVPMGFCYPGPAKSGSGDAPPDPACKDTWHARLLPHLASVKLKLIIGQYAQAFYLGDRRRKTLTETVRAFRDYAPDMVVLPHPSPRNNIWLRKNPWFEEDVLPYLRQRVSDLLKQAPMTD